MTEINDHKEDIDALITPEFNEWWEAEGQFIRSGGGNYERTFAYGAFRHLIPKMLALTPKPPKPWTKADQAAGILPEEGSFTRWSEREDKEKQWQVKAAVKDTKGNGIACITDGIEIVRVLTKNLTPNDTLEEAEQREKAAWAEAASDFIDNELDVYNIVGPVVMSRLYAAMVDGDLAIPKLKPKKGEGNAI